MFQRSLFLFLVLAALSVTVAQDSVKEPEAPTEDRVGFPKDYARTYQILRTVVKEEEKQWSGVVLVPTEAVVSRAYTSLVEIPRIEAHPQLDKRMRVWARVVNPTNEILRVGVTCSFRSSGELDPYSRGFEPMVLPPGRYRDVAFISPSANVESYTILVKRF